MLVINRDPVLYLCILVMMEIWQNDAASVILNSPGLSGSGTAYSTAVPCLSSNESSVPQTSRGSHAYASQRSAESRLSSCSNAACSASEATALVEMSGARVITGVGGALKLLGGEG